MPCLSSNTSSLQPPLLIFSLFHLLCYSSFHTAAPALSIVPSKASF
jgi:hypothetical protein